MIYPSFGPDVSVEQRVALSCGRGGTECLRTAANILSSGHINLEDLSLKSLMKTP